MLPSNSTGEQYSSPLFNNGLKMLLKDSASVRPRTDSGRADRNAKCTPACEHNKLFMTGKVRWQTLMLGLQWAAGTEYHRHVCMTVAISLLANTILSPWNATELWSVDCWCGIASLQGRLGTLHEEIYHKCSCSMLSSNSVHTH